MDATAGLTQRHRNNLRRIRQREDADFRSKVPRSVALGSKASTSRFGARTGYCLRPELPRTAREAHISMDPLFTDTRRVFFANRGLWDAISSSGPHPGFAHEDRDVDAYLGVLDDFLDEMCA
jgi:hypothetical protein